MKIQNRNKLIMESKLSMREMSKKYNISYERIRQIITKKKEREEKEYQKIKVEYSRHVKSLVKQNLRGEIKRLSNKGRNKKIIIQKTILIVCLKDNFGFSLRKIADLFNNDHTTIGYLYHSYFNKIK